MKLKKLELRGKRHEHSSADVIRRFIRRRWKAPMMAVGAAGVAVMLMGAMPSPWKGKRPVMPVGGPVEGVVESLYSKGVGTPWTGSLQTVAVRRGQSVKKGDLLFKMDTSGLTSDLTTARLARASFVGQVAELRKERDVAARDVREEIAVLEGQLRSVLSASQQMTSGAFNPQDDGEGYVDQALPEEAPAVEGLRAQIAEAHARLQAIHQDWEQQIQTVAQSVREYDAEIARLKGQIATAERTSPATGVVTALYVEPGNVVGQAQPVVRIDNPAGYRVVTLVSKPVKDRLPIGTPVSTEKFQSTASAKLERVVPGWDKDLFRYYMWWKPANPKSLAPGERVTVHLPEAKIPVGPALAVASTPSGSALAK